MRAPGAAALLLILAAAACAEKVSPVVDSNVKCILGASRNGRWLNDEQAAAALQPDQVYRVWRKDGEAGSVRLGKAASAGPACEGTYTAAPESAPPGEEPYLILGGSWNPQPRAVADISSGKGRYKALFEEFLKSKGIESAADIRQLLRADLEGDGKDEVIGVLRNEEYSAVLLRKIVGDKVQTLVLEFEKGGEEGGLSEQTVPFISDLNGDGTLEVVVYGRYLQGVFTAVYAVEGDKVRKVLSCSCGG